MLVSKRTLTHVNDFINQIERYYPEISTVQVEGFRAFIDVNNAQYQRSMDDFTPYLEDYLGIKLTK